MSTFIISTQQSDYNLLRLMLNKLPDIATPYPTTYDATWK